MSSAYVRHIQRKTYRGALPLASALYSSVGLPGVPELRLAILRPDRIPAGRGHVVA